MDGKLCLVDMDRRRTFLGLLALPFSAVTSALAGTPIKAVLRKATYECHSRDFSSPGVPLTVAVKRVAEVDGLEHWYRDEDLVIVDFYASDYEKKRREQKSAGIQTYVISSVTNKDIVSLEHLNCTGTVFAGRSERGRELAFLTHQDPTEVLYENRSRFLDDLGDTLEQFLASVEHDTVAYGFFGGNYFHAMTGGTGSKLSQATMYSEHYVSSIVLLADMARKYLPWLEPIVVVRPNVKPSPVDFRFHTQERKLEAVTKEHLPPGFSLCRFPEYLRRLERHVL
jgi:hypothetical protein